MILNQDSRLVRWTYLLRHQQYDWDTKCLRKYPQYTTLCAFFWRAFVLMPLFWIFVGGVGGMYAWLLGTFIWGNLKTVGVAAGASVALAGLGFLLHTVLHTDWATVSISSVQESTFIQGLKAVKGKFCPLIEIKRL